MRNKEKGEKHVKSHSVGTKSVVFLGKLVDKLVCLVCFTFVTELGNMLQNRTAVVLQRLEKVKKTD